MDENNRDKFSGKYLKYTGVGFELAGSVVLFCLIGYFVDKRWGTEPKGFLIGSIVGIVVGLYLLIKTALTIDWDNSKDKTDEHGRSKFGK